MEKVVITGGSGLVGKHLTLMLQQSGFEVCWLSRTAAPATAQRPKAYRWNVEEGYIDSEAITTADYIVHLAGAGVAEKRWTPQRKEEILKSRTESTRLLAHYLAETPHTVKAVVMASAIGLYGFDTGDALIDESHSPANDFLASVVKDWEQEAQAIEALGIRLVKLRIGIVLSGKGGALVELARPVRWGAGAALGTGKQWMSWVHIDDLCQMFIYALQEESLRGAYNAVAPQPLTNRDFTREVAKALGRPLLLPAVPAFAMRLLLGEMAQIVLGGNKISSSKIEKAGYKFQFTSAAKSLRDLLKKN
jgi:uncharacterized protein